MTIHRRDILSGFAVGSVSLLSGCQYVSNLWRPKGGVLEIENDHTEPHTVDIIIFDELRDTFELEPGETVKREEYFSEPGTHTVTVDTDIREPTTVDVTVNRRDDGSIGGQSLYIKIFEDGSVAVGAGSDAA
jgi:hypothetical protein